MTALETHRAEVVADLRATAHRVYDRLQEPISTNDVRYRLAELGYEGDPRILGCAFTGWKIVGTTMVRSAANSREIKLFVPEG